MAGRVSLRVTGGPLQGQTFDFEEKDTFIFGRSRECHAHLPRGDRSASRHHFMLEVNPPDACLRDLGSLNGTFVNGVKHGGRKADVPDDVTLPPITAVGLVDGDTICVGTTEFLVNVESPKFCLECGGSIPEQDVESCRWISGSHICRACRCALEEREKARGEHQLQQQAEVERRRKAQAQAQRQVQQGARAAQQRQQVKKDPMHLLLALMAAGREQQSGKCEIPGYEVLRTLGAGGMGAVYLARRRSDDIEVAIKVMLSRVAVDPRARNGFEREIRVTQQLRHPNIVELFEHGSAGSGFYFVMEVCRGGGVEDLVKKRGGKLNLKESGPIMLDSLRGLAHAHSEGFVHRDLKPANILLDGAGRAKIADFGLAKEFERAGFSGMTVTGQFGGTPGFMPREQVIMFRNVKPVSDVWSIAATFYRVLTGHYVKDFRPGQDPVKVILQGKTVPIAERDPTLPSAFVSVLDRALAQEPSERYQDGGEMLQALEEALG